MNLRTRKLSCDGDITSLVLEANAVYRISAKPKSKQLEAAIHGRDQSVLDAIVVTRRSLEWKLTSKSNQLAQNAMLGLVIDIYVQPFTIESIDATSNALVFIHESVLSNSSKVHLSVEASASARIHIREHCITASAMTLRQSGRGDIQLMTEFIHADVIELTNRGEGVISYTANVDVKANQLSIALLYTGKVFAKSRLHQVDEIAMVNRGRGSIHFETTSIKAATVSIAAFSGPIRIISLDSNIDSLPLNSNGKIKV